MRYFFVVYKIQCPHPLVEVSGIEPECPSKEKDKQNFARVANHPQVGKFTVVPRTEHNRKGLETVVFVGQWRRYWPNI